MKSLLLRQLGAPMLNLMLDMFPAEVVREVMDTALDGLERKIRESPSQYDDLALPVIQKFREIFNIDPQGAD